MSDYSPLRLAEQEQSSPSQSLGSQNTRGSQDGQTSNQMTTTRGDTRHNRPNNIQPSSSSRQRSPSESSTKSGQLRYGAKNVIELFIPVSLCMLIVVGTIKATDSYRYSSQTVIWYAQMMFTDQSVDTSTRVWQSFANALIMLVCIMVMTTVLILLYKFRCYATIHGWLILGSLVLLFMFALMYVSEILKVYNLPMDIYTLAVFIWNFGVVGMICIHWKGPLLLQQAYLIVISALMALVLIRCLPDWTIWTVLAIVSVWDLIAVLCPRGPLRILVETAQERNESIFPALIYSSTMMWEVGVGILTVMPIVSMADEGSSHSSPRKSEGRTKKGGKHGTSSKNQSSAGSSSRHSNGQAPSISLKRDQHPVEIQYDDGAEPPEVTFVQPNISSGSVATDNEWRRPPVRALDDNGAIRDRRSNARDSSIEPVRNVSATEVTINFRPQDSRQDQQFVEEERGVKLGLGDFIFFSVLVGKASSYGDWTITLSCYVAILVGLCLTLSLLAIFRKALPALPISIAFGLSAFFLSYVFVVPFAAELAASQVFI